MHVRARRQRPRQRRGEKSFVKKGERESLHSHPTEGWSSNTHLKASAYIIADGSIHSVPVEHSNTRWSKPVGRGRSEVCQLASSATCLGAVAQTKGIRCSHPSCVKGTAVLALNGELRGHAPGGDGKPPDGGNGTDWMRRVQSGERSRVEKVWTYGKASWSRVGRG